MLSQLTILVLQGWSKTAGIKCKALNEDIEAFLSSFLQLNLFWNNFEYDHDAVVYFQHKFNIEAQTFAFEVDHIKLSR